MQRTGELGGRRRGRGTARAALALVLGLALSGPGLAARKRLRGPVGERAVAKVREDEPADLESQFEAEFGDTFLPTSPARELGADVPVLSFPEPPNSPLPMLPAWRREIDDLHPHMRGLGPDTLRSLLADEDRLLRLAVLDMVAQGKAPFEISGEELAERLWAEGDPLVAGALVRLFARAAGPEDHRTLAAYVDRQGPASDVAVTALARVTLPEVEDALVRCASRAHAKDRASLLALRAVARIPGDKVRDLISRCVRDFSDAVHRAAVEARAIRSTWGLSTEESYRPPPIGDTIAAIAKPRGTYDASSGRALRPGADAADDDGGESSREEAPE